MKVAIIALVAVLLLGGGVAGAYFYFDKPAVAAGGPIDEAAKAEHDAKTAEAAEGAAVPAQEFVQLDALILPVIDEHGVTQVVSMVVTLEVPDKATADEVKRMSPRIQDAFIQDMYGVLNRKNSMENGVLKVNLIKGRMNRLTEKVLGPGKVNEVLLQVVQQRNL